LGVQLLQIDEPLSNLDAKLRTEMGVELKRLHQELGRRAGGAVRTCNAAAEW
jgi:ABC-type Fe3+/spermidine/putrescine transport system ATPase subunit